MRTIRCLLLFLSTLALSQAGVIVSVGKGVPGSPALGGTSPQYLAVGWTSTVGFSSVSIDAYVFSDNLIPLTAYLTTQIGPSATSATLLASTNVTSPGVASPTLLFSGLTLTPGTYYLVIAAPNSANAGWQNGNLGSPVTDPHVTLNSGPLFIANFGSANTSYPPGSTFVSGYPIGVAFDVISGVPEPASITLVVAGLAMGCAMLRRRRS